MKRREFITLLGGAAAAWPVAARAQSQPKMLRVGFVGVQPRESPLYAAFLERMTELGYQEGQNFTFEYIQTPNIDGYEKGYRELAGRKVDVFLAVGNERALLAARAAAKGGPIAFLAINFDPLAKGYVASLSQPGGNVTGIFVRQLELAAKRVESAREAFPSAKVVGIAFDTVSREQRDAAAEAARKLGLEPRMIEMKGQHGYGGAFDAMHDAGQSEDGRITWGFFVGRVRGPRRRGDRMKRLEFIALLGGTAVAWPLAARAQRSDIEGKFAVLPPDHDNDIKFYLDAGRIVTGPEALGRIQTEADPGVMAFGQSIFCNG